MDSLSKTSSSESSDDAAAAAYEVEQQQQQLHVCFVPFVASGHMIPLMDIARIFAARPGIKVTVITTPQNALPFQKPIDQDVKSGHQIQFQLLKFPSEQVGLPIGVENFKTANSPDTYIKIYKAICMLLQPDMKQILLNMKPDCIISDTMYPWTTDIALQLGCPRITFIVTSFFSYCVEETLWDQRPQDKVLSDVETFIVPDIPDMVEMTRLELDDQMRTRTPQTDLTNENRKSEQRCYGYIMNSFYELEPSYVDHFNNFMGRKAWHLGPVCLAMKRDDDDDDDDENNNPVVVMKKKHECLSWLDSMKPNSVVYISFGSLTRFPNAQLLEIAIALESSGHPFIWMVKQEQDVDDGRRRWLPEDLKEKLSKLGMIIKGWAPQVAILKHSAIGGFMTHCGWNSTLESIAAGVPMIAWPIHSEQFFNERLVTRVLKIGVAVGNEEWYSLLKEPKVTVMREKINKAVTQLMDGGEQVEEMRKRVKQLSVMAKKAVEEQGSSYASLSVLIEQLKKLRSIRISSKP